MVKWECKLTDTLVARAHQIPGYSLQLSRTAPETSQASASSLACLLARVSHFPTVHLGKIQSQRRERCPRICVYAWLSATPSRLQLIELDTFKAVKVHLWRGPRLIWRWTKDRTFFIESRRVSYIILILISISIGQSCVVNLEGYTKQWGVE